MSAITPTVDDVILMAIDHSNKIFYRCDPTNLSAEPEYKPLEPNDVTSIIATTAPAKLSAVWRDQNLCLSVGYILVAYMGYTENHVTRDSAKGLEMAADWEEGLPKQ